MNKSKALSRQKAKCVTDLTTNQSVCLQTEKNHEKIGFVKNPTVKPHSYIVNVQEREYRRIRKHFLPVAEQNHLESQLCVTRCYFAQHLKRRLKQATLVLFKSLYHVKKVMKTSEKPTTTTEQSIFSSAAVTTRLGRLVKPPSRYTM